MGTHETSGRTHSDRHPVPCYTGRRGDAQGESGQEGRRAPRKSVGSPRKGWTSFRKRGDTSRRRGTSSRKGARRSRKSWASSRKCAARPGRGRRRPGKVQPVQERLSRSGWPRVGYIGTPPARPGLPAKRAQGGGQSRRRIEIAPRDGASRPPPGRRGFAADRRGTGLRYHDRYVRAADCASTDTAIASVPKRDGGVARTERKRRARWGRSLPCL
jgi:hypothetical protein